MHEHRQNRAMVGSVSPSFGRTQITPRSVRRHPPVAAYGPPADRVPTCGGGVVEWRGVPHPSDSRRSAHAGPGGAG